MPRKQAETTDSVVFNGITFRRYPNSKKTSDRRYYRADGRLHKHGINYLHREVWKFYNGEIPDGYHVHHKDGNPLNNDISNLELLTEAEHRAKHHQTNLETAIRRERTGEPRTPEWVANHLATIRPKAAEWHRSDEGREWHRQHGIECAEREAQKPKVKLVCVQCGKEFLTPHNRRNYSKFCSKACYAKYRRDNGIDDETRICPICGKEFRVNRFSKTKTCSRECGNISIGITRRNKSR